MATRHWKWLTLSFCIAQIPSLFLLLFISESPKWLIERNQTAKALQVLQRICRINRHHQTELQVLISENRLEGNVQHSKHSKTYSYWHLFRDRESIKRILTACLSWFTISAVYYGIVFYIGSLPGDPVLNSLIFALVRTLFGLTMPLLDKKVL